MTTIADKPPTAKKSRKCSTAAALALPVDEPMFDRQPEADDEPMEQEEAEEAEEATECSDEEWANVANHVASTVNLQQPAPAVTAPLAEPSTTQPEPAALHTDGSPSLPPAQSPPSPATASGPAVPTDLLFFLQGLTTECPSTKNTADTMMRNASCSACAHVDKAADGVGHAVAQPCATHGEDGAAHSYAAKQDMHIHSYEGGLA